MRIHLLYILVAALAGRATAAEVTAYVTTGGPACPSAAMSIAADLFQSAGVRIHWTPNPPASPAPGLTLGLHLAHDTPAGAFPGALAVSYPYNGSRTIVVFYDRVRELAGGASREPALLAYVFVHEMTHVIQGVDRHSDVGILKASWSKEDRFAIFHLRLTFEDTDLLLIRSGLTARSRSESAARPE